MSAGNEYDQRRGGGELNVVEMGIEESVWVEKKRKKREREREIQVRMTVADK